jgi:hypothetical protein
MLATNLHATILLPYTRGCNPVPWPAKGVTMYRIEWYD